MIDRFLALIVSSTLVLVIALALATTPDRSGVLQDSAVLRIAMRK
jgi:hypothetical protein